MRRAHPTLKATSAMAAALPEKFRAVNVMSREQCNQHATCVQNKEFWKGGRRGQGELQEHSEGMKSSRESRGLARSPLCRWVQILQQF